MCGPGLEVGRIATQLAWSLIPRSCAKAACCTPHLLRQMKISGGSSMPPWSYQMEHALIPAYCLTWEEARFSTGVKNGATEWRAVREVFATSAADCSSSLTTDVLLTRCLTVLTTEAKWMKWATDNESKGCVRPVRCEPQKQGTDQLVHTYLAAWPPALLLINVLGCST